MDARRVRFGEFEFDRKSGELRRVDGSSIERLAPQPARLLALLIEKDGELLDREEIREQVWPGVTVEFDSSLHFCARQIRSALGDSATEPRYVETLPRRGYRLMPPVTPVDVPSDAASSAGRTRPLPRAMVALAVVVVAIVVAAIVSPGLRGDPALRIGVMPFEAPDGSALESSGHIAEWILEDLTKRADERAEVIGPTSTETYVGSEGALRQLASDYRLDYIVNARFLERDGNPRMLAELIRVSDGAHIWVEAYEDLRETQRIGLEISDAVTAELELEE